MTWTATLTKIEKDGANLIPTVVLTNSVTGEKITEVPRGNDITMDRLKLWVKGRIDALDARDASELTLSIGEIGAPTAATKAQTDAEAFFDLMRQLRGLRSAIGMGLIDANNALYASKLADAKAAFKPIYLTDPRFG